MSLSPAMRALLADAVDLSASLHLLSDAADRRGDDDMRGALRLLARHAEGIVAALEATSEIPIGGEHAERERECEQ